MSVMTGSRVDNDSPDKEDNFKRNLIISQDESQMSNALEDSTGMVLGPEKDHGLESSFDFVNKMKGSTSFYDGHMIGNVTGIPRNDTVAIGNTGPTRLPRLRFGEINTSNTHEGLTQSRRSQAPENSDDDVCSRRGLDDMTES
jgi:hypothetical protein